MKKSKKLRYPEYINGVKQIQNPFKRVCIKIWYSEWFRFAFILCPLWLVVSVLILMLVFPTASEFIRTVFFIVYSSLLAAGIIKNDWSELRKIGLDEYHRPLKQNEVNSN